MNITNFLVWVAILSVEQFQHQFKGFLTGYLKAQTTLVIFSLHNEKDHRLDVFVKRIVYNPIIGVEVWKINNNENLLEFYDMGRGIEDPSIIKSYLVFVDFFEIFLGFLFKFTKINSNGRWIFVFDKQRPDQIEFVFEEAWNKYKMLNILGVVLVGHTLQFCLYNPFQFNSNGVRGVFHYFEFFEWNKADKIYNERLNNLYGYPIRTFDEGTFAMFPTYNHNNKILRYKFTDGTVLICFEQQMNFKFIFLQKQSFDPKYFQSNSSPSGIVALIENNEIDIPSKSSHITPLATKNVAFLQAMDFIELCYIVPKQEIPINYLITQFEIFDFNTTIIFVISMTLLITIWSLIEFIRFKLGRKHDSLSDILWIIGQAQNVTAIPNFSKYNNRAILMFVVVFFIIICNTYQGIIASRLVNQPEAKEIDTLEDVIQSGLTITSTVTDAFRLTPDDIQSNTILYRLFKRTTQFIDNKSFFFEANKTIDAAILVRTKDASIIIPSFFNNKTGRDTYHMVQEKVIKLHRSYMIPKNSPYRERFREILSHLIEFGFIVLAIDDFDEMKNLYYMNRTKAGFGEKPRTVVIKMEHLDPLIILWFGCLGVATIVFVLEIVFNYFYVRVWMKRM